MDISLFERTKIQAQALVPILKAFQAELGKERANEIASEALAKTVYKFGQKLSAKTPGGPSEKLAALLAYGSAPDTHDIEILKQTSDAFEWNITRCSYAEFYKKLGEPELGYHLVCSTDFPLTEGVSPDIELVRTQTIMQGASHCDFRYRIKNKRK